jgi:hypothetical protein
LQSYQKIWRVVLSYLVADATQAYELPINECRLNPPPKALFGDRSSVNTKQTFKLDELGEYDRR